MNLQQPQDPQTFVNKITVWKCPNCVQMMALEEKCFRCKKSPDEFYIDVEFAEMTKNAYENSLKIAKAVKIEQETIETMWICP